VFASVTVFVTPLSVFSSLGSNSALMLEIKQRGLALVTYKDHASSTAPIAAGRSTKRDIRLAAKGDTTIASRAGFDTEDALINETHARALSEMPSERQPRAAGNSDFQPVRL
jgi:hypothetical protein